MEAKNLFQEYKNFLSKREIDLERERGYYETVTSSMKSFLIAHPFWEETNSSLRRYEQEYQLANNGYFLFLSDKMPEIHTKSFDSFIDKTFRKNALNNQAWPDPPDGGWLLPDNWLERITDIIRTCFIVKYLDGVNFLVGKIEALCKNHGLRHTVDYEAKDEGYYAAHIGITFPFKIITKDFSYITQQNSIEIQITTQLQDVIRKLTHKFYEERRSSFNKKDVKWQWDYQNDNFKSNYLGHILHYIEGMILDVRDNSKGAPK